jgi:LacI family gluconate utilization system Gnt-I transcriptional repressor
MLDNVIMANNASPTIKDVAQRAGVSPMTVSRSFSAPLTVASATRARVEAAAAEIGYLPDRNAGALRTGQSNLVCAVVPSLANSLFAATLQGLADGLRERGLVLALAENRYDAAELARLCREFLALRPRGLVLHDSPRDPVLRGLLARSGVPVVEVGDLPERDASVDRAIGFSNHAAAAAITRHLTARGHRRIGLLTLPPALSQRAERRIAGWRAALAEAGLPHGARLVATCGPGYAGGAEGLGRLLRVGVDAVLGGGDVLALGALIEAGRRGVRVPGDLAIASFDAHEVGEALSPRLTTLRLPRREIGLRAAAAIAGEDAEGPRVCDLGFVLAPGEGD